MVTGVAMAGVAIAGGDTTTVLITGVEVFVESSPSAELDFETLIVGEVVAATAELLPIPPEIWIHSSFPKPAPLASRITNPLRL